MILAVLPGCHSIEEFDNNTTGNFEALWTILNDHYCFFEQKNINWDSIHTVYGARIKPGMSSSELFDVCAEMLDELKDGHTNLSAPFNTSY